jgi:hypothetical protein
MVNPRDPKTKTIPPLLMKLRTRLYESLSGECGACNATNLSTKKKRRCAIWLQSCRARRTGAPPPAEGNAACNNVANANLLLPLLLLLLLFFFFFFFFSFSIDLEQVNRKGSDVCVLECLTILFYFLFCWLFFW